jgi:formamidopyrimidine-DNA glycosylase
MPELPEVEIVRRGLEPLLSGHAFLRVEQQRQDLRFPLPERFAERLQGRRVLALERRAKYMLARLSSGDVLVIHLGMTGRFRVSNAVKGRERAATKARILGEYVYGPSSDARHDHIRFRMSGGTVITYNDPRRFGFMLLIGEREVDAHPLFRNLGAEPLGEAFSASYLALRAHGRRCDLKAFLMDQRIIAGLGNIYVNEALYRARLSPKRRASCLAGRGGGPHERAELLVQAIKDVLAEALRAGGSTLRDYRHADGSEGAFQESFSVYDREGQPCLTAGCRGRVKRIVQGARSTFYCPACQR